MIPDRSTIIAEINKLQEKKQTRESELEKLAEENPIVADILEQRELQKILSTYVDALPKKADEGHRIHTSLNQTGTTTGRMSSNDPNLQNIPTRGDYGLAVRKAFIASKGYKIAALDYSQIEMRVLAWLTDDQTLTLKSGFDTFSHQSFVGCVYMLTENAPLSNSCHKSLTINGSFFPTTLLAAFDRAYLKKYCIYIGPFQKPSKRNQINEVDRQSPDIIANIKVFTFSL